MVTKSELKTLEQEIKLGWLGLLLLAVTAQRFRSVEEVSRPEAGLIGKILQGAAERRRQGGGLPSPAETEGQKGEVTAPTAQAEEKKTAVATVLLLLANQEDATSLAEAMQAEDIAVATASSAEEAYTMTPADNIKVFVVDEGFITTPTDTWKFRKNRIFPIAVIGARPEREGWDRVVQLDADAYLSKSTSRAEQIARIKALLRRA